ncbi:MAG: Rieske 2Fe-2S domain-containing protein [Candidatus Latescibacterota bacterium]|nr:MAG: Rieske 2Fe-2S domain-containing protein [Candidatus Latescibacterota bacterium]
MPARLEPEPVSRRDLLGLSGLWMTAAAVVGSMLGALKLPMPRVLPEAGARFRIGSPGDFVPGTEQVIKDRNIVVRCTEQGVAAVSLVCTHLGCIATRSPDGFHCPCHGSKFGDRGEVIGGPAPRGLRWLQVSRAADGSLVVDLKREVKPDTWYAV